MIDIRIDLQRAYDEGYEQGKKDCGRLKGEWINKDRWPHCSNCERYAIPQNNSCIIEPCRTPFCPWCGADMRGDKE